MKASGHDLVPVHLLPNGSPSALDAGPRMVYDLHRDAQGLFDPLLALAIIASVSPDQLETREAAAKRSQEQRSSMSIQDIGSMHFDSQKKALGIHQQMTLAPQNLFAPVVASFIPTYSTGLD